METRKERRVWIELLNTPKDYRGQSRLLYTEKLSITIYEENKISYYKSNFNNIYLYIQV